MAAIPHANTTFYAPQARLVDVVNSRIVGQSPDNKIGGNANPADIDLLSAKVTHVINDVCQLTVVLDNQRNTQGRPIWPPWKYNSLQPIQFGQRLRLDMRYGDAPWTKMILARVTDLQFGFPNGPAQLTVVGEDLLSLLKTSPEDEFRYKERKEDFIVGDALGRAKVSALGLTFTGAAKRQDPLKGTLQDWPELEPLKSITQPAGQSYLQFLQGIAERMDFEMFVEFGDRLTLDSEADPGEKNTVKLHFEPARSLVDPTEVLDLSWGVNLLDLTPKLKVWDMPTHYTYGGTHHGKRQRFKKEVTMREAIAPDLKHDTSYQYTHPDAANPDRKVVVKNIELFGADAAREKFFSKSEGTALENKKSLPTANLDEPRARLSAIAKLRKAGRDMLTAQGTTVGFPTLRPGGYVRIRGLYPPFDGLYYVTQTTHTFDGTGYRTQFSIRRPGLLDPSKYPDTQAEVPR